MKMRRNKSKFGFTLTELSMSMAFIALLLIAIFTVGAQLTRITQKGLAMKNINDVGRELVDEFDRTIGASNYGTYYNSTDYGNLATVYRQVYNTTKVGNSDKSVPFYGAFCSGNYSYVWNTGYALRAENTSRRAKLETEDSAKVENFRLLRLSDTDRAVCKHYDSGTRTFTGGTDPTELLSDEDNNLAIYDYRMINAAYDPDTMHTLYSMSFILGTIGGEIDITAVGDYCTDISNDLATDFSYCSVNKFNFAVRATGGLSYGS